jgi:hypothetical protein
MARLPKAGRFDWSSVAIRFPQGRIKNPGRIPGTIQERVLTDKPENKPIERLGRIIRTEIRTRAKPGATITWIFDKFDYRIPYEVLIAQPARKFAGRFEGEALVFRTEFSAGGTTLKLRNVTGVVSPGKPVSEEYIATKDAPESLLVTVEAKKR